MSYHQVGEDPLQGEAMIDHSANTKVALGHLLFTPAENQQQPVLHWSKCLKVAIWKNSMAAEVSYFAG